FVSTRSLLDEPQAERDRPGRGRSAPPAARHHREDELALQRRLVAATRFVPDEERAEAHERDGAPSIGQRGRDGNIAHAAAVTVVLGVADARALIRIGVEAVADGLYELSLLDAGLGRERLADLEIAAVTVREQA